MKTEFSNFLDQPFALRVNGMINPLGIEPGARWLTWRFGDEESAEFAVSAVRVVGAVSCEALDSGPLVFDSGKLAAAPMTSANCWAMARTWSEWLWGGAGSNALTTATA